MLQTVFHHIDADGSEIATEADVWEAFEGRGKESAIGESAMGLLTALGMKCSGLH
jgi:hypothetical protein